MSTFLHTLDQETIPACLDRFHRFYDAVVRRVDLEMPAGRSAMITIDVEARDGDADDDWVICRFFIREVEEHRFERTARLVHSVLSNGLTMHWDESRLFVNFEPGADEAVSTAIARSSPFFAAGVACEFSVLSVPTPG